MRHLILFLACALISSCKKDIPFDILILNGSVVDGTGFESVRVDIAIKESEIVKIGNFKSESAKRIIDASGLTISPGFIDLHAHLDPILKH